MVMSSDSAERQAIAVAGLREPLNKSLHGLIQIASARAGLLRRPSRMADDGHLGIVHERRPRLAPLFKHIRV